MDTETNHKLENSQNIAVSLYNLAKMITHEQITDLEYSQEAETFQEADPTDRYLRTVATGRRTVVLQYRILPPEPSSSPTATDLVRKLKMRQGNYGGTRSHVLIENELLQAVIEQLKDPS